MTPKVTLSFVSVKSFILSSAIVVLLSCGESPSFVSQTSEIPATETIDSGDSIGAKPEVAQDPSVSDGQNNKTEIDDASNNKKTDSKDDNDAENKVPVGDEVEDRITSEVKTNDGQTVAIDSFLLSDTFPVRHSTENSTNPLKSVVHVQDLGTPRLSTRSIVGRTLQSKSFQKTAPLRTEYQHSISYESKPIDIFVTVDDSESFTQAAIERTSSAMYKLIDDVYASDWRLFIGGLEGVSGNFDKIMISKGSLSAVQAKAAIDTALRGIFIEGSNGDERVIRSLNRLAYDYRNNDRDNAVHAYLIITDAPNCKDRNNGQSSACNRIVGQNDHHGYLQSYNANVSGHVRKNMQLIGAYYRQSNNLAVCGNADDIEVPGVGETLKLNSQFVEMSFQSERSIDAGIPVNTPAKWVGDLCSTSESLTWLSSFTDAIKTVAAQRFVLSQAPDNFVAPDTSYNLALHQPLGTTLDASAMTVLDTYVVVLNPALSGTVSTIFHKQNNFRKTNYETLLTPVPENGTVQLTWSTGAVDCEPAASFAGLSDSVKCRHLNSDLFLRDTDFLPVLIPGNTPVTVTVTYYNQLQPITVLQVTGSEAIYTDTLVFESLPPVVDPASAVVSSSNGGKTVSLTFPAALPAGDYLISYRDFGQTRQTVTLPSPVAVGTDSFLCYLPGPGVSASINIAGVLGVTPMDAQYPCILTAAGTIKYEGRIPLDENGKGSIAIAYKGFVAPISLFPLEYPPYNNAVAVMIHSAGSPNQITLAPGTYSVANNQVQLSDPLQPGEVITFDYMFYPPLKSCYLLSGEVWKEHKYHVWYGPPGQETRLDQSLFTIEKREKGQTICLEATVPAHGNRLIVGYVSNEKPRPDID